MADTAGRQDTARRQHAAKTPAPAASTGLAVLHITADYPDLNKPITTLAVKNLVDANPAADHFIVSLNRTPYPWRFRVTEGGGTGDPRVVSIRYFGLPFGMQLAPSLYLAAWIAHAVLRRRGIQFDVIHAHKLTFEGLVAYWLSRWSGKPWVCSLRGEVEQKVLRFKPHYMPLYRRAVAHCKRLYYVSAWFRPEMNRLFAVPTGRQRLLPNFVDAARILPREHFQPNRFVCVMCFSEYKRKGLDVLLPAFASAAERAPNISLDLIGRGTPRELAHIQRLIDGAGLSAHVRLVGPVKNQELLQRLGDYAGFLLPSQAETFGMAYVEALLSGVPILYSKGTGIDGYLDGIEGAVGVEARSVASVRDGILHMVENQHRFRQWLIANLNLIEARFDTRTHIDAYNSDLLTVVAEVDPQVQAQHYQVAHCA